MHDRELVLGILRQILDAAHCIRERFAAIQTPADFVSCPAGREKLDAICLPLSAIGESLKKIDKVTGGTLLGKYPSIDWKGAKATRDIIVHGYFDIDEEIVFDICRNLLPDLTGTIQTMLDDLDSASDTLIP